MAISKNALSAQHGPLVNTSLLVTGKNKLSFRLSFQLPPKGGKENTREASSQPSPREGTPRVSSVLAAGAVPISTIPSVPAAAADAIDTVLQALIAEADAERPMLEARDEEARARLEALLRSRKFANASVHLFGSSASGLRTGRSSDVDLCVHVPPAESARNGQPPLQPKKLAFQLSALLQRAPGYSKVECIAHAKVPLVKSVDTRAKGGPMPHLLSSPLPFLFLLPTRPLLPLLLHSALSHPCHIPASSSSSTTTTTTPSTTITSSSSSPLLPVWLRGPGGRRPTLV